MTYAIQDRQVIIEKTIAKIEEMMKDDGLKYLKARCQGLLKSGAVDLLKYNPDEYALAKIVLHVALADLSDQYRPLTEEYQIDVKNLKEF